MGMAVNWWRRAATARGRQPRYCKGNRNNKSEMTSLTLKFWVLRRAGELIKKLRESISDKLSDFPVVTGRLLRTSEGDWTIKCNDAGVRMVEARVEGTVDEWLKNVDRGKELKLVYWEEMFQRSYLWSTFYVQASYEKGFFGNCMVYNRVQGDGIKEHELFKAAGFIKEAVLKLWTRLSGWNKKTGKRILVNGSCLISANLENVDSYSAVFEKTSSPCRVSYYIEPAVGAGQILILPSPGGDSPCSRVVSITLEEVEAGKLLEDGLIKQFGPTICMGLNRNLS
ncbi:UNVERIFIED_CONTAM: hypothetical protein Sradi_3070200 [Sesamum radiatum]|uniref:Uncharacterized protein n=1 Tax=Sesamum radiatum TaxID=300843 RepID=A0AAW2RBX7_SESRA